MISNMFSNKHFLPLIFLIVKLSLFFHKIEAATPTFISHACQNTTSSLSTPNTTYSSNLNLLLTYLSSNTTRTNGFYQTTVGGGTSDAVTGLFNCRGDVNTTICQTCINNASKDVIELCPVEKLAVIWYDVCWIRYADGSTFATTPGIVPSTVHTSLNSVSDPNQFNQLLAGMMDSLANKASNSQTGKKFATNEEKYTSSETIYGLVQCTPDLSVGDCNTCLRAGISGFAMCCNEKLGGTNMLPSCIVRFETQPFYGLNASGTSVRSTPERRVLDHNPVDNNSSFLNEDLELPTFDLATIAAATNNFSSTNKIGEGGFGSVYMGVLQSGQEVAVKRLRNDSGQGLIEFKNEVIFIAKLQHRNLVKLLGCCIHVEDRILIYEYMAKKSLDQYIFNQTEGTALNWPKRFNIIVGIARGLLYLHRDSRLRLIHRDLKPGNILLDNDMNPKISDFGLARTFRGDQTQVKTRRIIGTHGYMSPEYIIDGNFSVKSDVFSFGVIVLEIVSGMKNRGFNHPSHDLNLLGHAWKLWNEGRPLEMKDAIIEDIPTLEVIRCIQVGLLCVQKRHEDRPLMSTVMWMLDTEKPSLPQPKQPGFFIGRDFTDTDSISIENTLYSKNDVTISILHAR